MGLAVLGSVGCGWIVHAVGRTGFLSMAWVSHVAAVAGAIALVLAMRVATKQHLA
jgi:uncharacterized membrane protein YeaQ/YmgE (transglycosylase-associated protein family)